MTPAPRVTAEARRNAIQEELYKAGLRGNGLLLLLDPLLDKWEVERTALYDERDQLKAALATQAAEIERLKTRLEEAESAREEEVSEIWADVQKALERAWPGQPGPMILDSPLEMVPALIAERDDSNERLERLTVEIEALKKERDASARFVNKDALDAAIGLVQSERNKWEGHDQRTFEHWRDVAAILQGGWLAQRTAEDEAADPARRRARDDRKET